MPETTHRSPLDRLSTEELDAARLNLENTCLTLLRTIVSVTPAFKKEQYVKLNLLAHYGRYRSALHINDTHAAYSAINDMCQYLALLTADLNETPQNLAQSNSADALNELIQLIASTE